MGIYWAALIWFSDKTFRIFLVSAAGNIYSVSKKSLPRFFSDIFPKRLVIFSENFTWYSTFLFTFEYKFVVEIVYYSIICNFDGVTPY